MSASKSSAPAKTRLTAAELRHKLEDLEKSKDRGIEYYANYRFYNDQLVNLQAKPRSKRAPSLSC